MEAPSRALRLLLFVSLSLLTRGPLLGVEVIDKDEAAHIVGSWELLAGRQLYVDFADNKPPLLYVYYALAQVLLGRGMLAVRLLTVLAVLPLTAEALSAFFRHDRRGLVAGVLYLVFGAAFYGHDMLAVNTEVLMLLPGSWALVLVRGERGAARGPRVLAAGLALGLAALFKPQALFWLPAMAAVGLLRPRSGRARPLALRLGALLLGTALPLLGTWATFAYRGQGDALVYWVVQHNLVYAVNPILPWEALSRATSSFVPFLLATAGLWWCAWRSFLLVPRDTAVFLWALLALSIPPATVGWRFFPHYFIQLYVPLALAAAPWASAVLERPFGREARVLVASTSLLVLGFTLANAILYFRTSVYDETRPVFKDVAARLQADPCFDGAKLFVWGFAPSFYYHAGVPPASRFVVPGFSLTGYVPGNLASASGRVDARSLIDPVHWDWLMEDLERNRATYIVDTAPAALHRWHNYPLTRFPRLHDYVLRNYECLDTVGGVDVYRRRGCGP